jgi:hypothetical protein
VAAVIRVAEAKELATDQGCRSAGVRQEPVRSSYSRQLDASINLAESADP